jgi:phenylpropionate dioxygenase-like ring-hydroxylating dioxygenase large terminal subunit
MFRNFANQWTAVAPARELGSDKPLGLVIAGERVVLFRDRAGIAHALIDVCPHRGVALSLGNVQQGCLVCPFHGWRFEGSGAVAHVPWSPDAKKETLSAKSLPLVEKADLLWLYTAPGPMPADGPPVPDEMLRNDLRRTGFAINWASHWTRAMENMLDWPHLPFVHSGTIGRAMRGPAETGRMDIHFEEKPWGAATSISINDKPEPGGLDYRFPNMMVLHIPMPWRTLKLMIACVPIDDGHTRMILMSIRNFLKPRMVDWIFRSMNRRVASEDKPILETSWPAEVPPPGQEQSVRLDKPTLYFRRVYRERIVDKDQQS